MDLKEYLIDITQSASETLFRTARRMPKERLTWHVEGLGRSALEILQECAQAPSWYGTILANMENPPEADAEGYEKAVAERKQWTSLEQCEAICKENTAQFIDIMEAIPDEELGRRVKLPFREEPYRVADMMLVHYWNLTYHIGQINFIQTLYGDVEMH